MKTRDHHFQDRVFYILLRCIAWGTILIMLSIGALLLRLSWPIWVRDGFKFFILDDWNPPQESFGALAFIFGTLATSLLAILFATPISVGVALFLTELAPASVKKFISFLVEMLAAIPSVVYGLWGVFVLVPFMQKILQPFLISNLGPKSYFAGLLAKVLTGVVYPAVVLAQTFKLNQWTLEETSQYMHKISMQLFSGPSYGVGLLTASIILSIMITPTISSICREVFQSVPANIREAALGLGATRWEMIWLAVLKSCKSGIMGAVILGLGRALGETMAVTMVIGNRNEIKFALLAPAQSMASIIANEYNEASGLHLSALVSVGLCLLLISLIVNSLARLIIWKFDRGQK